MSETESVAAAALEDAAAEYHPAVSTVALFRAVEIADSLVAEARAEVEARYAPLVEAARWLAYESDPECWSGNVLAKPLVDLGYPDPYEK